MQAPPQKIRISWYRCPVSRAQLRDLNQRSDLKGFLQTGGYLGLLALTAASVLYAAGRWPWPVVLLLLYFHGTCAAFLLTGFHELGHDSVFKTRWLNSFFLRIFAFLGWHNHHHFGASHMEHHKYTLHPPDDLEVVLPIKFTLKDFLHRAFVSPLVFKYYLDTTERLAHGQLQGAWENALFPASDPTARRRLFSMARFTLLGHGAIVLVSVYMHWWLVPVLVTLPHCYGGGLLYLCGGAQHVGLQDNVHDFRRCCRTFTVNPFVGFLYWHMNYHTEHHMYAMVPCYNLGKLHETIKPDMAACTHGLRETWAQIAMILARQKQDPTYQFAPELPAASPA